MRLYVATKERTVVVDDLPQEATGRDLTNRVLESLSSNGGQPSAEIARHYLVCDGRKLKEGASGQETSLTSQGVSDGSTLVLFKRRTPPSTSADGAQITHPSLEHIERVVRAEAERQGREVVAPAQPSDSSRNIAPLETRLHDIMQALQNMSGQGLNDTEMQRHVTQALRTAARLPAGAEQPMNEEVVVPEPNPTHIAQLGDMGFSAAAARRALLLNRNAVNAAANYLLAHGGDGDIEAEPTEQELRQVYRARNVRLAQPRLVEALPELMEQLTSMGFSEAGSRHALVRNDNNLDAALNLLTSMPPGWEPAPEDTAEQASGAEGSGEAAEGAALQGAAGAAPREAENDPRTASDSAVRDTAAGLPEVGGSHTATEGSGGRVGEVRAADHTAVDFSSDSSAAVAALVEAAARAIEPTVQPTDGEAAVAATGANVRYDAEVEAAAEVELLLDAQQRGVVEVRQGGEQDEQEEGGGDREDVQGIEGVAADEEADVEDYQTVQEEFLRHNELLDNMTMMDLQEGMRGIMSALGGSGGTEGSARMSGALPILSTGSGEGGIMDPLRLVDDMRWGNGFPGLLGGLMDENADEGALDDDEFNDDDGFHTETTYADDEEDAEEGDEDEDMDEEAEVEDDDSTVGSPAPGGAAGAI